MTAPARTSAATWAALIVVYLVWGSTYLAIRVLVRTAPPLLAMGVRFTAAGLLLMGFLMLRHGPGVLRLPRRQALSAAMIGVLLLGAGNGGVAFAEQVIPSGLAALLVAEVPLWLVCLRLLARDTPRRTTMVGTALGFAGIAILALPGSHPAGTPVWGVLVIIGATICWSSGSFASPRLPMPSNPFVATVYEMLASGVVLIAAGAVSGEFGRVRLSAMPPHAWIALVYLVLFGSLLAFSAYVWLLGNAPLSLTATYAYVNPVVAVLLGALILGEQVTWPILIGGAVVVVGVSLVASAERPRRDRTPARQQVPAEAGPAGGESQRQQTPGPPG
ncbi:MAG TPA: EamA family transporter [Streptosporangiaceae bacterium]